MGLIKAVLSSAAGVAADQWKEYFTCDSLPADVLCVKGHKRSTGKNAGSDNVITNGSIIAVADGQCMLIVDNGKIVDICAEPGEYKFDASSEPSILAGGLNKANIMGVLSSVGKRFTFGGEIPKTMRVYYVNTKELPGNKYGTPNPVPFRVVDERAGIDIDISLRCFGEYSYRITNPLLFFTGLCGNISAPYTRDQIDSQLKSEVLTNLQPALARISAMGIRYSELPAHTVEIADSLNEVMSAKWRDRVGIEIATFGVSSASASEEDVAMLKEMQRNTAYMDPARAAAMKIAAEADALKTAAGNSAGAAVGIMGYNAVGGASGTSAADLYAISAQQRAAAPAAPAAPAADSWVCASCGKTVSGKFCPECGAKKPEPVAPGSWVCPTCGKTAVGKFCAECGTKKPETKCPQCGWTPADGVMPKFCPECGTKL